MQISSSQSLVPPLEAQRRRYAIDAALIALIACGFFIVLLATQSETDIRFLDNAFYLNRTAYFSRGWFIDYWVYNVAYSLSVIPAYRLTGDLLLGGMITNTILVGACLGSVYTLSMLLFHRRKTAWIAVLLLLMNITFITLARLFWAQVLFLTVWLWQIILFYLIIRRPTAIKAILLGAITGAMIYVRFEGVTTAAIIPLAAFIIYLREKRLWSALRFLVIAAAAFTVLVIPYALNFLYILSNRSASSVSFFGVFTLLNTPVIEWRVVSRRFSDLLATVFAHWHWSIWLVLFGGMLWFKRRHRWELLLLVGVILFNLGFTYALSIYPFPVQTLPLNGFLVILAAAAMTEIPLPKRWQFLGMIPLVISLWVGISHIMILDIQPPFSYTSTEAAQRAQTLDTWLAENGQSDTPIYVVCTDLPIFSRSNIRMVYTLVYSTGWTEPDNLAETMRAENAYLIICDDADSTWRTFRDNRTLITPAETIAGYTLYRAASGDQ